MYSVRICNSVLLLVFILTFVSISLGSFHDKYLEKGAETLEVFASIPSEITQTEL
ncbi:hypothetical protein D3C85_1852480 [compost metagenome]